MRASAERRTETGTWILLCMIFKALFQAKGIYSKQSSIVLDTGHSGKGSCLKMIWICSVKFTTACMRTGLELYRKRLATCKICLSRDTVHDSSQICLTNPSDLPRLVSRKGRSSTCVLVWLICRMPFPMTTETSMANFIAAVLCTLTHNHETVCKYKCCGSRKQKIAIKWAHF